VDVPLAASADSTTRNAEEDAVAEEGEPVAAGPSDAGSVAALDAGSPVAGGCGRTAGGAGTAGTGVAGTGVAGTGVEGTGVAGAGGTPLSAGTTVSTAPPTMPEPSPVPVTVYGPAASAGRVTRRVAEPLGLADLTRPAVPARRAPRVARPAPVTVNETLSPDSKYVPAKSTTTTPLGTGFPVT
jgi:hypothetical protein